MTTDGVAPIEGGRAPVDPMPSPAATTIAADRARPARPLARLVLPVLLLVGLAVRIPGLDAEPPAFHTMRQLHSAMNARAAYADMPGTEITDELPPPRQSIEPPISEHVAAATYALTGGERLWVARLLSSLYWVAGGAALWALLRRYASFAGQVAGTAVYLFAPIAVQGGRSFQPDSLMVASMVTGMWLLVRALERPSRGRWIAAIGVSAFAVVVKAVVAPMVLAFWLGLVVSRDGWAAVRRRRTLMVGLGLLAPTVVVYSWKMLANAAAREHSSGSFFPSLFGDWQYYASTYDLIERSIWRPATAIALLAPFVVRGRARVMAVALWVGYVAYNVPSNYRTSTHDYYHLPLVVVVAFGTAVAVSAAGRWLAASDLSFPVRRAVAVVCWIVVAAMAVDAARGADIEVYDGDALVARSEAIGRAVPGTGPVLAVAADYGTMLNYYGLLEVEAYPLPVDDDLDRLAGRAIETPAQHIAASDAAWFVVTDTSVLEHMPELAEELARYELAEDGGTWALWDLTRRVPEEPAP